MRLFVAVALLGLVAGNSEPMKEAAMFDGVDNDHDGYLSHGELKALFFLFDPNHDKTITKQEFTTDWVSKFQLGNERQAHALFQKADQTDDGLLKMDDLPFIFQAFDLNGDDRVDMNEFLTKWGDLELYVVKSAN
ncbi:uncharacterized protein LOC121384599 [Gigantopelta aegis]|uniref:uncharacterized protein LOC121384599 n=1 Tax=Gigantopelta aegis TaxID=1735272 RepID=UPI001B887D25|nr:uncharacterized protein LOC121384599 [Gigantopelta aegis]